jgi:amino acid adenylation domain-containing protein
MDGRRCSNDDSAMTLLQDYLIASAAQSPDKIALTCGGRAISYRELDRQSNAVAHALQSRGVARGDRVAIFSENTVEGAASFWGALKADAVAVMVNPLTRPDKLAWILQDCRASALVVEERFEPIYANAAARSPHLSSILTAHETVASQGCEAPPARRNLDVDLAALIYTSGSTGFPKGVMMTHRNMLAASESIGRYLALVADDVLVNVLPLAFDYSLYQLILAAAVGARLVLERSFTFPAAFLDQIARERVTVFPGVPTMFAILASLHDVTGWDLSSVRMVTSTAAALLPAHIEAVERLFPRSRLFAMYGLTECKRCTYLPPEDLKRKPGSVGIAIPNTEIWVIDDHGNKLPAGEAGQLVVRGATVMKGYWEKAEETAERLKPGPLPDERVLWTGDLCRMDGDGYVWFVARMDDIIKSRGEKVAPAEVEAALTAIAGVKEAAAFGVPDEILGQAIKALVVLEAGVALDINEIRRRCHERLESFMVPKHIQIVAALPRTDNGKVRRADLHLVPSLEPGSSQGSPPTS